MTEAFSNNFVYICGMKSLLWAIILLMLTVTACGSDDTFTVRATVEGLGTQNVRVYYRNGDRVISHPTMALDGKFSFSGVAKNPVLVDIYTSSRTLIGSVVVKNGDNLEVNMKINEPATFVIKGNKISEELTRFNTQNSEIINNRDFAAINKAVAEYVKRNPDNPAAYYVMLTLFTPVLDNELADSLMGFLNPAGAPRHDIVEAFTSTLISPADTLKALSSLRFYNMSVDSITTLTFPGHKGLLLAMIGDETPGAPRDSVTQYFNRLEKRLGSNVNIVEISLLDDTAASHRKVGNVKVSYVRGWMPAGLASPALEQVRPAQIPWFIVTDTLGNVTYSGNIFQDAVEKLPH